MTARLLRVASGVTIVRPSNPRYEPIVAMLSKALKKEGEQSGYVGTSSAFAPIHISEALNDSAKDAAWARKRRLRHGTYVDGAA
jgi:hypothetical protein